MAASHTIDGYELLAEDDHTNAFVAYRAQREGNETHVRLILFDEDVSDSPQFRAAFRKDQPSLKTMHHPHLLSPISWGEEGGLLYYVAEYPPGCSLADRLAVNATITWDEFIDLGWQIASALQHAHNVGITHGHLTTSLISVSDEIRSKVMGFGLHRWIAAANSEDPVEPSFEERAIHDLTDFGHILEAVFHSLSPETMQNVEPDQVTAMTALIKDLQHPAADLLARDIQGRLGDMLLQVSGEKIEMVDHREGQHLNHRSLVDELFDEPPTNETSHATPAEPQPADSSSRTITIVVAIALAAILALVAFLNR